MSKRKKPTQAVHLNPEWALVHWKKTNPPSLWCCPRVTYESQRFNSIPWWLSCAQQSVTTFHSAALTLLRSSRGSLTLTELTSSSRCRYFIQALMWARWETAVTGAWGYLSSCYQSWQSELRIYVCVCYSWWTWGSYRHTLHGYN